MIFRTVAGLAAFALTLGITQPAPAQISKPAKSRSAKSKHIKPTVTLIKNRKEKPMKVYIGTYTRGESKGIYVLDFDPTTGKLTPTGATAPAKNPTFLALSPNGKTLFACEEIADYEGKHGTVVSFSINPSNGAITRTSTRSSEGEGPCHVLVDAMGKHLFTANYGDGVIAVYPISKDGTLGKATSVKKHDSVPPGPNQPGPHAHAVNLDPTNHYLFSCDLGTDSLFVYRFDSAKGTLTPNNPATVTLAAGAGPRHFAMQNGRDAYILNELDSTLSHFHYEGSYGTFTPQETISTLPEGTGKIENSTAEVFIHPNSKFLYGSNRGHDSIAVFAIEKETGKPSLIETVSSKGKHPRNFALDPSGKWMIVANQNTDNLVIYAVNPETGKLTATGDELKIPAPVCVVFAPKK